MISFCQFFCRLQSTICIFTSLLDFFLLTLVLFLSFSIKNYIGTIDRRMKKEKKKMRKWHESNKNDFNMFTFLRVPYNPFTFFIFFFIPILALHCIYCSFLCFFPIVIVYSCVELYSEIGRKKCSDWFLFGWYFLFSFSFINSYIAFNFYH